MRNLTKTEINILLQFKLQGFWGNSGSLTKKQRLNYLVSLINRGYLDKNCNLTKKASQEILK